MKFRYAAAVVAMFVTGLALCQQQMSPVEKKKQNEFRQRTMAFLTPEEKAHLLDNGKIDRKAWVAAHPARESTGMIPLPDLGKGMYQGEQGGLYPGGVNTPPPAHLKRPRESPGDCAVGCGRASVERWENRHDLGGNVQYHDEI